MHFWVLYGIDIHCTRVVQNKRRQVVLFSQTKTRKDETFVTKGAFKLS